MPTAQNREILNIPPEELVPDKKNSRTHTESQIAQIAKSIEQFGFTNPILIDDYKNVIAGHGRLAAALTLRMPTVPCISISGWTEMQKRAYLIADNQLALNAGWDKDVLRSELQELQAAKFDISLVGFNPDELKEIFTVQRAKLTDADHVPEVPKTPISKPGDIWQLGPHRVMCGSATESDDVAKLMAGELADMVWTDPPYNVAIDGAAGKIMNDDMADGKFKEFLDATFKNYFDFLKLGGCIYVAHADSERLNFTASYKASGLKLSQVLIWAKQTATLSRQDYNWQHEPIIYGWKEGAGHYFAGDFTLTTVIDDWVDLEKQTKNALIEMVKYAAEALRSTVARHDRPIKSDLHPTMKPVSLVQQQIEASSKPGWTVLDLFGGSGTTLIAAEIAGRASRVMELDPKFCDVIILRWQEMTGLQAVNQKGKAFGAAKK